MRRHLRKWSILMYNASCMTSTRPTTFSLKNYDFKKPCMWFLIDLYGCRCFWLMTSEIANQCALKHSSLLRHYNFYFFTLSWFFCLFQ